MKARDHDISANVGDGVSIRLPRLRFEIERRQAERLRDVLNTVLPPATALHLLSVDSDEQPTVSGPFKDEHDRVEGARDYRRAHGPEDGLHLLDLHIDGTVGMQRFQDAELTVKKRRGKRRIRWVSDAWIDGRNATIHRNTAGLWEVNAYADAKEPRLVHVMALVHEERARARAREWTFTGEWPPTRTPVHVGDDVLDPSIGEWRTIKWVTGLAVGFQDGGTTMGIREAQEAEKRPRSTVPPASPVHVGDRVCDPMDETWREVVRIDHTAVYFADGGCMGIDEAGACAKLLPSEAVLS